jgi:glutamate carboxypeptidase
MRLIILFLFFLTQIVFAGTLSPTEKAIKEYIDNTRQAQLSLLEKLVNINSGTTNPEGVYQVGKIVQRELDKLGFTTRWAEEPANMHKAGTLIAERNGNKGKRLLLIGHLDTVFPKDSKFQQFIPEKHIAKGPGVIDDKGGVVVILAALKALQAVNALDDRSITVVLTGDEEESGKPTSISRKPLMDIARNTDVALDFEPTMTLDTATIGRRGISAWIITAHGNESHSATIFQKDVGDGAIFELSRILNTMRAKMAGGKDLTFNPGFVSGGTSVNFNNVSAQGTVFGKTNVVSKIAMAKGDYRYLTPDQKQEFEQKLKHIVKEHLPGTKAEVVFEDGIPAMQPTKPNIALLSKYSQASEDLGMGRIKPFDPALRGAGDISFVANIVPASLAGLGPMGIGSHSVIEAMEINSLPVQAKRAAVLIYRLTS